MESFSHYMASEGQAFCSRSGLGQSIGNRAFLVHGALIVVFGVLLPYTKGLEFLDPVLSSAYACLGVLFAAPASAQAFAGDRPGSMKQILARILVSVVYGESLAIAMLVIGIVTVNVTHPGRLRLPLLDVLAAASALGLCASLALAAVAAWITLRFSPEAARRGMRVIFLLLLMAFFLWSRWLPDVAEEGAILSLIVAGLVIFALRKIPA
jgi:hypothetical protein